MNDRVRDIEQGDKKSIAPTRRDNIQH